MSAGLEREAPALAERVRLEVERTIARGIKGVEYLGSPAAVVGQTPKEVIHKQGTLNLYHYTPVSDELYRVPVLIVMATSNRGYILDLAPGQSFVEFLLQRGYDVYMIDWSPPSPNEKGLRFEDYTLRFIPDSVRRVKERSGEDELTVLGYCMGGVLSTIYSALRGRQDGLKNLVTFTTPIDFRGMSLFRKWSDPRFFDVDRLVDATGNVPSELIFSGFDMLRPASRIASQIQLWDNMWNDEFVKSYRRFERWGSDTLPLAGEYFRQTVKELIWKNALYEGTLELAGSRVDLTDIKVPMLHALAEHDHIVPYEAAGPLIEHVGSGDKQQIVLKGGHVSIAAGPNASKRLWPKLDAWLGQRSV